MPRYRVTVAYDGTGLVGWQRQATGTSIQGLIEDALYPFENRRIAVTAAGRTDAGVHALGQVAAFTLDRPIDPAALVRALNARLPPTVRVLGAADAAPSFHPRFDAISKTYRYRIFTGPVIGPFEYRYAWHLPGPLDVDAMAVAAGCLIGEHDFAAFQASGSDAETTIRLLSHSTIIGGLPTRGEPTRRQTDGPGGFVTYTARGTGFLRHMVRAIVGSLVEIGRGRRPVTWMQEVLELRDRAGAGPTAPPEGLCLVAVEYAPPLATQP